MCHSTNSPEKTSSAATVASKLLAAITAMTT